MYIEYKYRIPLLKLLKVNFSHTKATNYMQQLYCHQLMLVIIP